MFLRSAFALIGFLAVLAVPATASDRLTSTGLSNDPGSLWQQAIDADSHLAPHYAAAMLNYRHFATSINGERAGGAYPMLPGSANLNGLAWVWVAEDGSHIQRVNRGLFRHYVRERSSAFYRIVDCRAVRWPTFTCTDGSSREMSAPSYARMIFGDQHFERVFAPHLPREAAPGE